MTTVLEFTGVCVAVYAVVLLSEILIAAAVDVWEEISR